MTIDGRDSRLRVLEACRFGQRLLGIWAWRGRIPPGRALRLVPCAAVQTLGLPRAIDVAFCAADGRILKLVAPLPPGRVTTCRGARSAWEFQAGTALRLGLAVGCRLALLRPRVSL
jgi:uncharacterized membrane protein (UPF0127 family)